MASDPQYSDAWRPTEAEVPAQQAGHTLLRQKRFRAASTAFATAAAGAAEDGVKLGAPAPVDGPATAATWGAGAVVIYLRLMGLKSARWAGEESLPEDSSLLLSALQALAADAQRQLRGQRARAALECEAWTTLAEACRDRIGGLGSPHGTAGQS